MRVKHQAGVTLLQMASAKSATIQGAIHKAKHCKECNKVFTDPHKHHSCLEAPVVSARGLELQVTPETQQWAQDMILKGVMSMVTAVVNPTKEPTQIVGSSSPTCPPRPTCPEAPPCYPWTCAAAGAAVAVIARGLWNFGCAHRRRKVADATVQAPVAYDRQKERFHFLGHRHMAEQSVSWGEEREPVSNSRFANCTRRFKNFKGD
jgi:hypothetical protein